MPQQRNRHYAIVVHALVAAMCSWSCFASMFTASYAGVGIVLIYAILAIVFSIMHPNRLWHALIAAAAVMAMYVMAFIEQANRYGSAAVSVDALQIGAVLALLASGFVFAVNCVLIRLKSWGGWLIWPDDDPDREPCLRCGYDVRGSEQKCPECGEPIRRPSLHRRDD